jgi:DNA polymerase
MGRSLRRRPATEGSDVNIDETLDAIDNLYGPPLQVISDCLRAMIVAKDGHDLIAADFANIEGRVLAWLAGEQWKVDAFKDYDTIVGKDEKGKPIRKGDDLYLIAAGRMYGKKPSEVTKHRQEGKCVELGMGFGGGARAALTMARTYNVNLDTVFTHVWPVTKEQFRENAKKSYAKNKATWDLSEEAYLAGDIIKQSFREQNPNIAQFWYDLENAAIAATVNKGEVKRVGKIMFKKAGSFLWCRLPSGRSLCYPYPRVAEVEVPWTNKDGTPATKPALFHWGVDPVTKQWAEDSTYGGMLAENVTQAVARDILAASLIRLEKAGYNPVLHVHDEVVCEVPHKWGSVEEMQAIMAEVPAWAEGLPIAVEGYRSKRYKK